MTDEELVRLEERVKPFLPDKEAKSRHENAHTRFCYRIGDSVVLDARGVCPECGWHFEQQTEVKLEASEVMRLIVAVREARDAMSAA